MGPGTNVGTPLNRYVSISSAMPGKTRTVASFLEFCFGFQAHPAVVYELHEKCFYGHEARTLAACLLSTVESAIPTWTAVSVSRR